MDAPIRLFTTNKKRHKLIECDFFLRLDSCKWLRILESLKQMKQPKAAHSIFGYVAQCGELCLNDGS